MRVIMRYTEDEIVHYNLYKDRKYEFKKWGAELILNWLPHTGKFLYN